MNDNNALDFELLNGYLDNLGKEMLRKMFALYTQQAPKYIQAISQSLIEDSSEQWQESCHKMKGAASSTGFLLVREKLIAMEKSNGSATVKREQIELLKEINKRTELAFSQWLESC
ncbi:Hpt domain-containing protein [Thalassotalea sp. PLHSN55]|uniref:Hpt domain-containing protein n=1 Tax=Thalassotalea sp. PLHSN55 TaxID=3435888 RepID=UPI003F831D1E